MITFYHKNMRRTTTFALLSLVVLAAACTSELNNASEADLDFNTDSNNSDTYSYDADAPVNYREEMISLVSNIADYARQTDPSFIVVPQNGEELILDAGGNLNYQYLDAVDGLAREDLFYGYEADNKATPRDERHYMESFLSKAKAEGETILTIDYCWSPLKIERSFSRNYNRGYRPFVAPHRALDIIPDYADSLYRENDRDIHTLADARNFLYLINPRNYGTKEALLQDLEKTNHDLVVIDLFLYDDITFTAQEIARLKTKANGGQRLVLAYLSVGEAEDYRYYWQSSWTQTPPSWLEPENPNWPGNFKVQYWHPQWQSLLLGSPNAYLDRIISAGFDGTYLDLIDAYYYFETKG